MPRFGGAFLLLWISADAEDARVLHSYARRIFSEFSLQCICRTAAFSVEYGFPRAVAVRAKAHADLFFAAFFFGERRQIVLVKAADPDRLRIFGKFSAELVAEVEYFDHTVCVRRKIVKIAVLHGDDRLHRDVEPPLPPSFP